MALKWPSFSDWFRSPTPQYIPVADVSFPETGPVMPMPLPPTSQKFHGAQFNKMLNIPATPTQLFSKPRYGQQ